MSKLGRALTGAEVGDSGRDPAGSQKELLRVLVRGRNTELPHRRDGLSRIWR